MFRLEHAVAYQLIIVMFVALLGIHLSSKKHNDLISADVVQYATPSSTIAIPTPCQPRVTPEPGDLVVSLLQPSVQTPTLRTHTLFARN